MNEIWQVEIVTGPPADDDTNPPLQFGTPQVFVSEDGLSERTIPLIYGPVALRSVGDELLLETYVPEPRGVGFDLRPVIHRTMDHVLSLEFDWTGDLRITGLETRADGAAVLSLWQARPYRQPGEDCEDCAHPKEWHTRVDGDEQFAQSGRGECISKMDGACNCTSFRSLTAEANEWLDDH